MIIAKFNHWHCLSEDDIVAGVGGDEAGAGVQTAAANKSTSDRTGHWAWPTGRCCGSLQTTITSFISSLGLGLAGGASGAFMVSKVTVVVVASNTFSQTRKREKCYKTNLINGGEGQIPRHQQSSITETKIV